MIDVRISNYSRDDILPVMKTCAQWICWSFHRGKHRSDKIPLDTNSYSSSRNEFDPADYKNSKIWLEYGEAKEIEGNYEIVDGIGFVFKNYKICYVDIDNCVTPDSLTIEDDI